jgi:hypothetical protein
MLIFTKIISSYKSEQELLMALDFPKGSFDLLAAIFSKSNNGTTTYSRPALLALFSKISLAQAKGIQGCLYKTIATQGGWSDDQRAIIYRICGLNGFPKTTNIAGVDNELKLKAGTAALLKQNALVVLRKSIGVQIINDTLKGVNSSVNLNSGTKKKDLQDVSQTTNPKKGRDAFADLFKPQ